MQNKATLTLGDIAELAGVSKSTASRALRNNSLINKKTREKVQAIAREHNFKVNASASSLRLQKTNTVAVVILFGPDSAQSISDPFLLELLGTIADELTQNGYDMLLTTSKTSTSQDADCALNPLRADGLIVIGQGTHDPRIDLIANENKPYVVWGAIHQKGNFSVVGSDNRKGGYLATKHLLEQGCRRIAFMGNTGHSEIEQRWLGYQDALKEFGLTVDNNLFIATDFTSNDGYQNIQNALKNNKGKIDAVFAVSDVIAFGVAKYLNEQKIKIPEKIALVGFDDVSLSEFCHPSLSTIKQDTQKGGHLLVNALLSQLKGKKCKTQLMDVELIIRESSRKRS